MQSVLAACAHHRRNKDALAVANEHRKTDAAVRIASAVAASTAQRQGQQVYCRAYDHWCREYVVSFVRRHNARMGGLAAAQAKLAEYREEDRVAQEKRVQGDER